jgi:hypothetical protein
VAWAILNRAGPRDKAWPATIAQVTPTGGERSISHDERLGRPAPEHT